MKVTNHERICRTFIILRDELKPFVLDALSKADGPLWERRMREALNKDDTYYGAGNGAADLDIASLLYLITVRWRDCFGRNHGLRNGAQGYVSELRELRNKWAHQVDFDDSAASRAIETAKLLLEAFGCTNVQELIDIRNEIVAPVAPVRRRSDGSTIVRTSKSAVTQTDYAKRLAAYVGEEFVGIPPIKRTQSKAYPTVTAFLSNSVGLKYPRLECLRCLLYQISMYSKMSTLASERD